LTKLILAVIMNKFTSIQLFELEVTSEDKQSQGSEIKSTFSDKDKEQKLKEPYKVEKKQSTLMASPVAR